MNISLFSANADKDVANVANLANFWTINLTLSIIAERLKQNWIKKGNLPTYTHDRG